MRMNSMNCISYEINFYLMYIFCCFTFESFEFLFFATPGGTRFSYKFFKFIHWDFGEIKRNGNQWNYAQRRIASTLEREEDFYGTHVFGLLILCKTIILAIYLINIFTNNMCRITLNEMQTPHFLFHIVWAKGIVNRLVCRM